MFLVITYTKIPYITVLNMHKYYTQVSFWKYLENLWLVFHLILLSIAQTVVLNSR